MENFYTLPEKYLSMSLRVFRDVIKARGWKNAKIVISTGVCIIATRPDGKEIRFSYGTPPNMSYGAGMIADDKYATYCMLEEVGVKQPHTIIVNQRDDSKEDSTKIVSMISKYSRVVVKPVDGAHGADVYTNVNSAEKAMSIIDQIAPRSGSSKIIVQQQLKPTNYEVRVICIDYHFVKAFARIPACVTGDGEHSVIELIDIENRTKRTKQYRSNLSYINKEKAVLYLKEQALENGLEEGAILDSIPEKDTKVQVIGICNTGQGGTMEDVTDGFPEELKVLSEKITRQLELPLAGVDFLDDYVIEVNKAPALYHPVDGPASTVCIEKFVDYLEKL